jgi:chorismate mutase/prephenate dehydratase
MKSLSLDAVRNKLDEVDESLFRTLKERLELVHQVAQIKAERPDKLRNFERENAIVGKIREMAQNANLDEIFFERIFRDIIEQAVREQERTFHANKSENSIRVGFQGSAGAYSHLASQRHFSAHKKTVDFVGFYSFEAMLDAVLKNEIDYSMLPIENSIAGTVHEALAQLLTRDLSIVGEEFKELSTVSLL